MPSKPNDVARAHAEAAFKQLQNTNVPAGIQQYRAEREALLERTHRLREERLAREAAQKPAT